MINALRMHALLFPPACWQCAAALDARSDAQGYPFLCSRCDTGLGWRDPRRTCFNCGALVPSAARAPEGWPRCAACPPGLAAWDRVIAPFAYAEPIRGWLIRLKYQRHDPVAPMLGALLARAIAAQCALRGVDWVLPVPLHPGRVRARGFSQSHLLAHHALRALRGQGDPAPPPERQGGAGTTPGRLRGPVPPVRTDLLRRHLRTRPQAELSAAERRPNVAGAFSVPEPGQGDWLHPFRIGTRDPDPSFSARHAIAESHVLLVDDVMTTGATLEACARTLRQAGARRVDALVLARA